MGQTKSKAPSQTPQITSPVTAKSPTKGAGADQLVEPYTLLLAWIRDPKTQALSLTDFKLAFPQQLNGIDFAHSVERTTGHTLLTAMLEIPNFTKNSTFIEYILTVCPALANKNIEAPNSYSAMKDHPLIFAFKTIQKPEIIALLLDKGSRAISFDNLVRTPLVAFLESWTDPPLWLLNKLLDKAQNEIDSMLYYKSINAWVPVNKLPPISTYTFDHIEPLSIDLYISSPTVHGSTALAISLSRNHKLEIFSRLCSFNPANLQYSGDSSLESSLGLPAHSSRRGGALSQINFNVLGLVTSRPDQASMVSYLLSLGLSKPIPLIPKMFMDYKYLILYYRQLELPLFPTYPSVLSSLFYHYNPFVKTFFRLGLQKHPLPPHIIAFYIGIIHYTRRLRHLTSMILYLPDTQLQETIFDKIKQNWKKTYSAFFEKLHRMDSKNEMIARNSDYILRSSIFPLRYNHPIRYEGADINPAYLPIPTLHSLLSQIDPEWWGSVPTHGNNNNKHNENLPAMLPPDVINQFSIGANNNTPTVDVVVNENNLFHVNNSDFLASNYRYPRGNEQFKPVDQNNQENGAKSGMNLNHRGDDEAKSGKIEKEQIKAKGSEAYLTKLESDIFGENSIFGEKTQNVDIFIQNFSLSARVLGGTVKTNSLTIVPSSSDNGDGSAIVVKVKRNSVLGRIKKGKDGETSEESGDGDDAEDNTEDNAEDKAENNTENELKNPPKSAEDIAEIITELFVTNVLNTYHQIWFAWCNYFHTEPFGSEEAESNIRLSSLPKEILGSEVLLETFLSKNYPRTYHNTITKLSGPDPNNSACNFGDGERGLLPIWYEGFYNTNPLFSSTGPIPFIGNADDNLERYEVTSLAAVSSGEDGAKKTAPLIPLALLDQISIIRSGIIFRQPGELLNSCSSEQYYGYLAQLYELGYRDDIVEKNSPKNSSNDNPVLAPPNKYHLNPENIPQPGETYNFNHVLVPGLIWWVLYYCSHNPYDDLITIISHCRCDILNNYRQSTLMIAIAKQWPLNAIIALAKKITNSNLTDAWGRNALHYYCMTGASSTMPELLDFLVVECGIVVNTVDAFGHSPLSYALYTFAPTDVIKKLIDYSLTRFPNQYENYYRFFEPKSFHNLTQSDISPTPFLGYSVRYPYITQSKTQYEVKPIYDRMVVCDYNINGIGYQPTQADLEQSTLTAKSALDILNYDSNPNQNSLTRPKVISFVEKQTKQPIVGISIKTAKATFEKLTQKQQQIIFKPTSSDFHSNINDKNGNNGKNVGQKIENVQSVENNPSSSSSSYGGNFVLNYPFGVNYLAQASFSNDLTHPLVTSQDFTPSDYKEGAFCSPEQLLLPTIKQRLSKTVIGNIDKTSFFFGDSIYVHYYSTDLTPATIMISLFSIMIKLHYPNDIIFHLLNRIKYGIIMSSFSPTEISEKLKKNGHNLKSPQFIELNQFIVNQSQTNLSYCPSEELCEKYGRISYEGRSVFNVWNSGGLVTQKDNNDQIVNGINLTRLASSAVLEKHRQNKSRLLSKEPNNSFHRLYYEAWVKKYYNSGGNNVVNSDEGIAFDEWLDIMNTE